MQYQTEESHQLQPMDENHYVNETQGLKTDSEFLGYVPREVDVDNISQGRSHAQVFLKQWNVKTALKWKSVIKLLSSLAVIVIAIAMDQLHHRAINQSWKDNTHIHNNKTLSQKTYATYWCSAGTILIELFIILSNCCEKVDFTYKVKALLLLEGISLSFCAGLTIISVLSCIGVSVSSPFIDEFQKVTDIAGSILVGLQTVLCLLSILAGCRVQYIVTRSNLSYRKRCQQRLQQQQQMGETEHQESDEEQFI